MSSKVEEVARALYERKWGVLGDWQSIVGTEVYDEHMTMAKVAILAMREPSEEMVEAGNASAVCVDSTATSVWRSMIDELTGERHREVTKSNDADL